MAILVCKQMSSNSFKILLTPQSSSITEDSPSDCVVSYSGHSLEESYPSAEMQLVYSAVLVDWTKNIVCVCVFLSFFCLMAYQPFVGYLMPKPFS